MQSQRMELEDRDLRRAIRAELRNKNTARAGPMVRLYAKETLLEGMIARAVEMAAGRGYSEQRCFLPQYERLSTLLDAILLELYREEFAGLDSSQKDVLHDALLLIAGVPKRKTSLLDELKGIPEKDGRRVVAEGVSILQISQPYHPENRADIKIGLNPYPDEFEYEAGAAAEDATLRITRPHEVLSSIMEWALITACRLLGFEGIAYRLKKVGNAGGKETEPAYVEEMRRLFRVSSECGYIMVREINGIEVDGGIYLTPALRIADGKLFFRGLEIGDVGGRTHPVRLEALAAKEAEADASEA